MKVAYYVPCYIDAFSPQVGIATWELLNRFDFLEVDYINRASCCGLPLTDMGYIKKGCKIEKNFAPLFKGYDVIVVPSGICAEEIRNHFDDIEQTEDVVHLRFNVYDIVEFLHDVIKVKSLPWAKFPHKVGLHNGCHSLRYLKEASPTELREKQFSKTADLLNLVEGLEIVYPTRKDECCGFGGTFSIWSTDCSGQMGMDKITDYKNNDITYVTSADYTCLLHQQKIADKAGIDIKTFFIAEILNGTAES